MRIIDADALCEVIEDHVTTVSVCPSVDWAMGKTQFKKMCLEDIKSAPTIPAIPVEWIKALTDHSDLYTRGAAKWVLGCWKKEQRRRNNERK